MRTNLDLKVLSLLYYKGRGPSSLIICRQDPDWHWLICLKTYLKLDFRVQGEIEWHNPQYGNRIDCSSVMTRYLKLKDLEVYMVVMVVAVVVIVVLLLLGNIGGKEVKRAHQNYCLHLKKCNPWSDFHYVPKQTF